jgi:hypothetical protein
MWVSSPSGCMQRRYILKCGHYIHYYESERISQEIKAFVPQIMGGTEMIPDLNEP